MPHSSDHIPIRKQKKKVLALLRDAEFEVAIETICGMPARRVVNPLFSFLYSLDETVKWRAVSAMGAVIAKLARSQIESARVIMRRFIWNLNRMSGGMRSPESSSTCRPTRRAAVTGDHVVNRRVRPRV